ncbi:MAG: GNAT family N-acetyltransferase [Gammaproteobacteria bacterium]|nr:GNAT family N-acetyltransferase [Gammaproteobacteria bacterium]
MSKIKALFRDYRDSDYESCEALVSDAWKFDSNFKPQELSEVAKCMYTKGSLIGSNFKRVVEINGKVVGFIFGLNEMSAKPKRGVLFGLSILQRILCIKGMAFKDKKKLFIAINTHEVNKSKIVDRRKSEITLFVVDPNYQGVGNGKKLLSEFITQCKKSGVKSIVVETNKLEASSFYAGVGFKHLGDFDSPLHEYATKGGQACMYEYTCE